ncbi:MAG: hypothetical protein DSY36_03185 [Candidatus Neomarinimicrobiota bacterium]|nr:MAG: hypothetical protein DSY36_03185 [Candidatus Neomarinimicrobiota bacterium]
MMRIIGIIMLLMVSLQSERISADSLFALGNRYFRIEKYDYALDAYSAILEQVEHPDLYFNMGNTFYRLGDVGKAVWAYEKGLQFSPRQKDLNHNLDIVNTRVQDRIEMPQGYFFIEWYSSLKNQYTLQDLIVWGGLMILLFALAGFFKEFGILDMVFAGRTQIFFLILTVVIHGLALDKYWELSDREEGVVVSSVVNVRSAPVDRDEKVIFRIHEGLKVDIAQSQPGWFEIILLDGKKGWIPYKSLLKL